MGVSLNPRMFREYDVRGVVERDLPPQVVTLLGKAVGTVWRRAGATVIALGRDCRLSSDEIAEAFVEGVLSAGVDVINVGVVPTPVLYFAVHTLEGVGGGVMITGSHNSAEYNGFKILVGEETLHGGQIQLLAHLMRTRDFESGQGQQSRSCIVERYMDHLLGVIRPARRRLRLVVDAGNGTGGVVAAPLYRSMGHHVTELFCNMDGRFPNHHPDPTVAANLEDARRKVQEVGAHLAIGFDGDSDRIGVVDDQGQILWGDRLMILLARQVLAESPGATIIGEVKCSQTLFDDVRAHGGDAIMWKVGHSLIKAKMRETGALLAGEMSGHIFFKHRYFGYDDAIYAGARLLEILAAQDRPLSELLQDVPATYSTPELRVECPDEIKFGLVEEVVAQLRKHHEVVDVDGVRVLLPGGAWGLVRASNTQPALVMRFEARTPEALQMVRDLVEGEVARLTQAQCVEDELPMQGQGCGSQ